MIPRPFRPMLAAAACCAALPAGAATFQVTTLADGGAGSLRQAIFDANNAPGADQITFAPTVRGILQLGGALPNVLEAVDIVGPGPGELAIVGSGSDRLFRLAGTGETFRISGLTLRGGRPTSGGGGAIIQFAGILTLEDVHLLDNEVPSSACGGALFASPGTETNLRRCVVADNRAGCGAGILARQLEVSQSAIYGNRADSTGGGLWSDGEIALVETTVSGNRAATSGGGIELRSAAELTLYHATLTNNVADSGPALQVGSANMVLEIGNTVIAGNRLAASGAEGNCNIPLGQVGKHNLSGDASCGFTGPGDLESTDPLLLPLAQAGGPTPSHVPAPGSPLIDAATADFCVAEDQRGFFRPVDGDGTGGAQCDIGAIEYVPMSDDPIHVDGFESGDLTGWSSVSP